VSIGGTDKQGQSHRRLRYKGNTPVGGNQFWPSTGARSPPGGCWIRPVKLSAPPTLVVGIYRGDDGVAGRPGWPRSRGKHTRRAEHRLQPRPQPSCRSLHCFINVIFRSESLPYVKDWAKLAYADFHACSPARKRQRLSLEGDDKHPLALERRGTPEWNPSKSSSQMSQRSSEEDRRRRMQAIADALKEGEKVDLSVGKENASTLRCVTMP
jgi:hypothetical protein